MEKRYQVFVSSTYEDLKEERAHIIRGILQLNGIPAGMEVFPGADEEQLQFIKRIIDDCDYYLLVVGGRYGSMDDEGISYTEREYDYAVDIGIPIIALLHNNPAALAPPKRDTDERHFEKLTNFRDKVAQGRVVKMWSDSTELGFGVMSSLANEMKIHPRVGWVRANAVASENALSELNEVRKLNDALKAEVADLRSRILPKVKGLAPITGSTTIAGWFNEKGQYNSSKAYRRERTITATWEEIWAILGPKLFERTHERTVRNYLMMELLVRKEKVNRLSVKYSSADIDAESFERMKIQFVLNFVSLQELETVGGGVAMFWTATAIGRQQALEIVASREQ